MKLILNVILAYNKPITHKMECIFDEKGGTIGRGLINDWVLPDEKKYLSRSHASIECVRHTFYLLNTSTNGIFLNSDSTSLEANQRLKLEDGMHLIMGGYKMEVSIMLPPVKPPPIEATPVKPIAVEPIPIKPPSTKPPSDSDLVNTLLRIAIQGTMEVLQSRAEIKQELHMDVTLFQQGQNNPIKLSSNVDEALQHLLTDQAQAFMTPEHALQEAFDDIKAHQIAVISGIQASLVHVLRRFEPEKLMQRLEKENPISAAIPVQRQAKLWAKFEELYDVIEDEVEEDFNRLFRQAFVKAYDEQIEKLRK